LARRTSRGHEHHALVVLLDQRHVNPAGDFALGAALRDALALYFASGINPRGFNPDDYHRGSGYQVRPALEIVTQATPFMAWRGKWGASSSSPIAPRRQRKWGDPNAFNATGSACTVGVTQLSATARAKRLGADVPAPRLTATRDDTRAVLRYRFARLRHAAPDTAHHAAGERGAGGRARPRIRAPRARARPRGRRVPAPPAGQRWGLRGERERADPARLTQPYRPRDVALSTEARRSVDTREASACADPFRQAAPQGP
jgi:hypothetical protein